MPPVSKKQAAATQKQAKEREQEIPQQLPVLPLRDIVIYPYMIYPLLIGRESSLAALKRAMDNDKFIFLAAQKKSDQDDPKPDDIYTHGTVAKIIQMIKLPGNQNVVKILLDGAIQGKIANFTDERVFLEATIDLNHHQTIPESDAETQALMRHAANLFAEYSRVNRNLPPEVVTAFENITDHSRRLYYAAANIQQDVAKKQKILESFDLAEQYFELVTLLQSEIETLKLEHDIEERVHESIQKAQKRFFVQEQIRALQEELGDEGASPELSALIQKIEASGMPEHILKVAKEEIDKLKKTNPMSPEFAVGRNYLDWLAAVPYIAETQDNLDIEHVRTVLNEDHYGLEKIKDRILEYIAVLQLTKKTSGQVLCLSGPPGVGKTSLARSIARALDRKFVRMSLGGVRDEAEIRGHRRTYIGAMPGKIIQSMKKAGTINPVILLDEVDKMTMDFRGDPSAALLEVLDPEQNSTFNDHFLEVDYDLSKVLFITTANVKYDIPAPLLDRMEIIELSTYLEHEKIAIAEKHLVPKQIETNGLADFSVSMTSDAIRTIVTEYTREAGVRNLERQIASVLRKTARRAAELIAIEKSKILKNLTARPRKKPYTPEEIAERDKVASEKARTKVLHEKFTISADDAKKALRLPIVRRHDDENSDKIGVVTGLAWTSTGGDILPVEVTIMPGNGKLTLTGKLGDVMKESAQAALSFVRANSTTLNVPVGFEKDSDIHIHVPEGAIPKDGPSAGITMTMALISAASGRPARGNVAMTGEITLRGNILAIGGLNEKLLAAKNAHKTTVLVPKENERDVAELADEVRNGLDIHFISHASQALPIVFSQRTKEPDQITELSASLPRSARKQPSSQSRIEASGVKVKNTIMKKSSNGNSLKKSSKDPLKNSVKSSAKNSSGLISKKPQAKIGTTTNSKESGRNSKSSSTSKSNNTRAKK